MGCGKHCRNPRLNGVSEHSGGEKSTLLKIHNDTLLEIGPQFTSLSCSQTARGGRDTGRLRQRSQRAVERDDKSISEALPGACAAGRKRSSWGDMAVSRAAEYQNRI